MVGYMGWVIQWVVDGCGVSDYSLSVNLVRAVHYAFRTVKILTSINSA